MFSVIEAIETADVGLPGLHYSKIERDALSWFLCGDIPKNVNAGLG